MLVSNRVAFKEWAVVCAALGSGRQTIILRKGGLDEGREEFRVKYGEFWLLPTRFHEDLSQLTPDAKPVWQEVQNKLPSPGKFLVDLYAVVEEVFQLTNLSTIERLAGEHILSTETIQQRFHYRHPGLFVLAVRIYRVPTPHEVSDSPYIAGCKSWVELAESLSTAGATPVLDDAVFAQRLQQIQRLAI
ncbi:MAG TPA: DUF1802 family protein [Pirellulales bacterium]|nr:DUF1802 family protein [Pirellulales bacterium]